MRTRCRAHAMGMVYITRRLRSKPLNERYGDVTPTILRAGHTIRAGGTPAVSISVQIIFGILIVLGYLVTPVALIWGWTRWARRPKQQTVSAILSLFGFIFAAASGILAVSSGCIRSSSPLSVLRSVASQDISMGRFAFPRRNPVWHQRCVATGSVALARACLWSGNARVLVARGRR
jgi:hypothetical protein